MPLIGNAKILSFILMLPFFLFAKDYRGAEFRSIDAFTYGCFEVRMQSAAASGMLSSFFTYHETGSTANWNEIDIEIMGRYSDEAQFNTITPNQTGHEYEYTCAFNPHNEFHVYAIEWTPDYVAWYVDSLEIYRQSSDHIATLNRAQKLMMNIWPPLSADWAGVLDPAKLPLYAKYDWVQYFAYTPQLAEPFTLQWRDDFNTWDQSRWQKASHTFDGNNCDFMPANAVFRDGCLVLCLTRPEATGYNDGPIVEQDVTAPYLMRARFYNDQVRLEFSEKLESGSAQLTANYIIPGLTVQDAVLQADGKTVLLSTSGRQRELSYNLFVINVTDCAQPPHTIAVKSTIVQNGLTPTATINVGGPGKEGVMAGQVFDAGRSYGRLGGKLVNHSPGLAFSGTDQDYLYQDEVRGISGYQLQIPNGRYRVTLYFAETEYQSTGSRLFFVFCSGQKVLENLDIFAQSGSFAACTEELPEQTVTDNQLRLYFKASVGEPVLSAIKVVPAGTKLGSRVKPVQDFNLDTWPNPFNPQLNIEYTLAQPGLVQLQIFDSLGRQVLRQLQTRQTAGTYRVHLVPQQQAAGLYYCRLAVNGTQYGTKKIIYLK